MPTWLWIVILLVVIGVGVGLWMRNTAPSSGPGASASGPGASASGPGASASGPGASDVSVARATTSSDAVPPAERFDDAAGETAAEVSEDAELRHDGGYSESVDPAPHPAPEAAPHPHPAPDPKAEAEHVPDVPDGEYGPGSAVPHPDGSGPAGFSIKANADSMLFTTSDSPGYHRSRADTYFTDAATAEAAGFKRWDDHRS